MGVAEIVTLNFYIIQIADLILRYPILIIGYVKWMILPFSYVFALVL